MYYCVIAMYATVIYLQSKMNSLQNYTRPLFLAMLNVVVIWQLIPFLKGCSKYTQKVSVLITSRFVVVLKPKLFSNWCGFVSATTR